MLTDATLDRILAALPKLRIGVLGDLFLDRYLDIDAALTEPSIETGLDAYQVVRVRSSPGAAGTIVNNLAALCVKEIIPIAIIGDDGEGHELCQALRARPGVSLVGVRTWPGRRTPTYTKPMLHEAGRPPRELNRLDIKNRTPTPAEAETLILDLLAEPWPRLDALLVLDQVSEADCGVVTARVRQQLAQLGAAAPHRFLLADSRERIGLFQDVWLKPNFAECRRAVDGPDDPAACAAALARRTGRPVFCTVGERGILVEDGAGATRVPAYPVSGPIDIVGAGDSTSAALACAVAAGASLVEAAAFGNLVASITIQQLGTTGTASPEQVRQRWREVRG
jgi:bifunctional ADP-heptose synthase (sugar kinase/adenylyltransferase)